MLRDDPDSPLAIQKIPFVSEKSVEEKFDNFDQIFFKFNKIQNFEKNNCLIIN